MNILLAVDGSEHSFKATSLLQTVASERNHSVTVLYVTPVVRPNDGGGTSITEALQESGQKMVAVVIREMGESRALHVEGAVVESKDVVDAIVGQAEKMGAELIAIGARGLTPLKAFFLGSVSQRVLRHAHKSVLIVRKPRSAKGAPLNVLVAVDGSTFSLKALAFLSGLGLPEDTRLTLIHVIDNPATFWAPESLMAIGRNPVRAKDQHAIVEKLQRRGSNILHDARKFLEMSFPHVEYVLAEGYPPAEIVEAAETRLSDLVVLGRGDHSGADQLIMGGVSHKVALHTSGSVLVVQ